MVNKRFQGYLKTMGHREDFDQLGFARFLPETTPNSYLFISSDSWKLRYQKECIQDRGWLKRGCCSWWPQAGSLHLSFFWDLVVVEWRESMSVGKALFLCIVWRGVAYLTSSSGFRQCSIFGSLSDLLQSVQLL